MALSATAIKHFKTDTIREHGFFDLATKLDAIKLILHIVDVLKCGPLSSTIKALIELEDVDAVASLEEIGEITGIKEVIASSSKKSVVTKSTRQHIITAAAVKNIITKTSCEIVTISDHLVQSM